jgi:Cna protein B-type domain.
MQLTDAPFSFDSVARADLWIVRIDGKVAGTDSADAEAGKDDDTDGGNTNPNTGWVVLAKPNQSYNLLSLQNGTTTNLGQITLPTGTYNGFRLILDTQKSSITLQERNGAHRNQQSGDQVPERGRTGVKIVLTAPISLTSGGSVMVLDFDLGSSFVQRGNTISQNGLLFKPVIRATARDITGAIAGTVTRAGAPVAGATVQVLKNGTAITDTTSANLVSTTATDATGNYKASFLMPGTYAVRATGLLRPGARRRYCRV